MIERQVIFPPIIHYRQEDTISRMENFHPTNQLSPPSAQKCPHWGDFGREISESLCILSGAPAAAPEDLGMTLRALKKKSKFSDFFFNQKKTTKKKRIWG